ncbi:hypothetical protein [Mycoplasmoides alvi]|uniref:hypothetical protein n=1 Tax=Mycoplasmoides alvi TaxID=78580 RepID=UPI00051AB643|nr:hypothetical protein [Mycoplasmoides alvi]
MKTEFSDKVIKEYLIEALKYVPGISNPVSQDQIQINNNVVSINIACLPNVHYREVSLMAQRTVYYGLFRETDGKKFIVNILISSIEEPNHT